jgi:hypothetical protein
MATENVNDPVLVDEEHPAGAGTVPAMVNTKTILLTLDKGEMLKLDSTNALLTIQDAG